MHATSFTKAFAQQSPVCIIPPKIPCISFFILNFLYFPSSSFYPKLRIFSSFVFSCLFLHSPASFPNQKTPSRAPLVSSETTPSWADVLICWRVESSTQGYRQAAFMGWGQLDEETLKFIS